MIQIRKLTNRSKAAKTNNMLGNKQGSQTKRSGRNNQKYETNATDEDKWNKEINK